MQSLLSCVNRDNVHEIEYFPIENAKNASFDTAALSCLQALHDSQNINLQSLAKYAPCAVRDWHGICLLVYPIHGWAGREEA
jgi:hypothetical protein